MYAGDIDPVKRSVSTCLARQQTSGICFDLPKRRTDGGLSLPLQIMRPSSSAMTLADRIVAMHGGVVQQVGAPLELYDRPANLFIAGFIGSPGMNFLEGQYVSTGEKAAIRFKDGTEIAVEERACFPQDQKVTLGIRPEHVVISPDGAIEAGVELVEPTGFGIIMHLSIHGLSFKLFTLHRSVLGATAKVRVDFPSDHLHVFDHGGKRIKERSSTD